MRLITSLDRYLYTESGDTIYAHQFIANRAEFADGLTVEQTQAGEEYPWSGDITFHHGQPEPPQQATGRAHPRMSRPGGP